MKNREWADSPRKARQTSFFKRKLVRVQFLRYKAFLISLEVLTKSLEYNPEQYFLLLGVSQ